jgi:hypothetical protein
VTPFSVAPEISVDTTPGVFNLNGIVAKFHRRAEHGRQPHGHRPAPERRASRRGRQWQQRPRLASSTGGRTTAGGPWVARPSSRARPYHGAR